MKTRLILAAVATVFAATIAISAPTFASLISGTDNSDAPRVRGSVVSTQVAQVAAQPDSPEIVEEAAVAVPAEADVTATIDASPATTVAPQAPAATEAPEAPAATEAPTTTVAPQAPAATEAPEAPTTTVAPQAPAATEAPAPAATEAPAPAATEAPAPAATEAPALAAPEAPSCLESAVAVATSLLAPHGIPVPEFNLDPASGPKAYYTVGGGVTIRDCVSDSIVAHELGHYVHFRVAKGWGAMATDSWTFCLGYDASTSRCEGGWLSDAGKTSEGRVMPGVEHAAHCIGNVLGVAGSYTKCPDDQLRAHASAMLSAA